MTVPHFLKAYRSRPNQEVAPQFLVGGVDGCSSESTHQKFEPWLTPVRMRNFVCQFLQEDSLFMEHHPQNHVELPLLNIHALVNNA